MPRPPLRRERPTTFFDLTLPELEQRFAEFAQPAFRAKQAYDWAYKHQAATFPEMKSLPAELRQDLAATLPITTLAAVNELKTDNGDTVKTLYETDDGHFVETVLMLYRDRATVCVSCQVGCAVGCAFCATGIGGLVRNLTTGEMVVQVVNAARRAKHQGRLLTNLVMMGMGEPLQNYGPTMKMVAILNDPRGFNFGARRMTISTSGIVPKIDALADEPLQINLAVSLHAPNDELRSTLVPINRRWPVAELMAAVERYTAKTGRRVSFEYAMMGGINDSPKIAAELADLLRGRLCHVNLIPYNPVAMLDFTRPGEATINRFEAILQAAGIAVTVRYSRGVEIAAACGQLRAEHLSQR